MCEEGWRFVVVDISVVFLHCLVSQVVYCIGSDPFEGVSRLLDAVVRFCDRGFEENAFQDAAPAT